MSGVTKNMQANIDINTAELLAVIRALESRLLLIQATPATAASLSAANPTSIVFVPVS